MADLSGVTKAIYQRLIGNAAVTTDLPTYQGAPAVFSGFIIPPDAPLPRVIIDVDAVTDESDDDLTSFQRSQTRDIFIYGSRDLAGTSSENPVQRIAENVRNALHLFYLSVPGWTCNIAHASGPHHGPTDETAVGRVVTLRYGFCEA